MKKDEKLALWSERIHDFQTSGQSYKAWCQENQLLFPDWLFCGISAKIEI
ncbi:MAG: IS66 family insertion sequence element accessory protein TnpA [Coprococcus comes]